MSYVSSFFLFFFASLRATHVVRRATFIVSSRSYTERIVWQLAAIVHRVVTGARIGAAFRVSKELPCENSLNIGNAC